MWCEAYMYRTKLGTHRTLSWGSKCTVCKFSFTLYEASTSCPYMVALPKPKSMLKLVDDFGWLGGEIMAILSRVGKVVDGRFVVCRALWGGCSTWLYMVALCNLYLLTLGESRKLVSLCLPFCALLHCISASSSLHYCSTSTLLLKPGIGAYLRLEAFTPRLSNVHWLLGKEDLSFEWEPWQKNKS